MSNSSTTVRDVFELPKPGVQGSDAWKDFRDRAGKEVKEIKTAALPDVAEKVAELLEIPLPDIFLTSWKKAESIKALLDESRQNPETVMNTELGDHTINSEHRPHIEIRIQNKVVRKIEFTLKLSFHLKGFVLKIRDGAVRGIQTGSCEAKGKLEYKGMVIAEKKLAPIVLPGNLSFGESKSSSAIAEKTSAEEQEEKATDVAQHPETEIAKSPATATDPVANDAGSFIPASALSSEPKPAEVVEVEPVANPTSPEIPEDPVNEAPLPGVGRPGAALAAESPVSTAPQSPPPSNEVVEPNDQPAESTEAVATSPTAEPVVEAAEERDTWEVGEPEETLEAGQATNQNSPTEDTSAPSEADDAQNILDQMSRELAGRRQAGGDNL